MNSINKIKETIGKEAGLSDRFKNIKRTIELLNNPKTEKIGREIVIRILDKKECYLDVLPLLKSVVRKSGLYPYLKSEFDLLSLEEELVLELYKPKSIGSDLHTLPYNDGLASSAYNYKDDEFVFHSLQKQVYTYLIQKKNVVLSASTSVGKSAIIDSIIEFGELKRIVIIVPTIALIDETRRRLSEKFGANYQVITHPSQTCINECSLYILTQERVLERQDLNQIDLFIVDEFYKLNLESEDDSRSVLLNIAFIKLLKNSKQFYFIGPNIDSVIGLSNLGLNYIFIPSEFSTVALNIYEFNLPTRDDQRINKTVELLYHDKSATMIYCQSPKSAVKVAAELISKGCGDLSDKNQDIILWLSKNYHKDWIVVQALRHGIGIHHGSLPRAIQQRMVRLFNQGKIKILVCTSTIIEGVNTSAKNVIIFDRRLNTSLVTSFTHKNIQGRAGRMGRHFVGNVYCLEEIPDNEDGMKEVDIAIGTQQPEIPLNLLYGVDDLYLTELSRKRMFDFEFNAQLNADIFSKNTKYPPQRLEELAKCIRESVISNWNLIMWGGIPNKYQVRMLCDYILILERNSLSKVNLSDADSLSIFLTQYLNSNSYSEFLRNKIDHYYPFGNISDTIDWLMKALRNAVGHNIPAAISTIASVLEYVCKNMGLSFSFDYGLAIHKFENFHLPSVYNALDEFGIPIQVAEKIAKKELKLDGLDQLLHYIKYNSSDFLNLDKGDFSFIKEAL